MRSRGGLSRRVHRLLIGLMGAVLAARLAGAPRSGTPARITPEHVARIVALACGAPSASGRPISQWSGSELAAETMRRGIVATISPRHAARLLEMRT